MVSKLRIIWKQDGAMAALAYCKTKLHPDVCKGIALPKMRPDMRPDTCWPDRPKPKKQVIRTLETMHD